MEFSTITTEQISNLLPRDFFCRPAELVAQDLIGCILVKKQPDGNLLSGIIVETEAYSQTEASCHGHKGKTKTNTTLFGEPGRFYIYLTYGIYHCVNIVTDKNNFASGVLLRSIELPGKDERIASGPGLLARIFQINKSHDGLPISIKSGLWVAGRPSQNMLKIVQTTRIGISKAKELPWRWYLQKSRSISKRAKGDRCPKK